jgi:hypothetical protein
VVEQYLILLSVLNQSRTVHKRSTWRLTNLTTIPCAHPWSCSPGVARRRHLRDQLSRLRNLLHECPLILACLCDSLGYKLHLGYHPGLHHIL